jgi:hypothetical protein
MSETELEIQTRPPPMHVVREADAIASQGKAGRVRVEYDGSGGWRVIADGKASMTAGPPHDVPAEVWDDRAPYLPKSDFDSFADDVKEMAQERKLITTNYKRADAKGFWKITLNYDDPRRQDD